MRKLLALGIVVAVLGALDQAARLFAENKLAERARAEAGSASSVDASISSFPFLGRLLVFGAVRTVEVRAHRSALGDLVAGAVEVDLRGVELEREALLSGDVRLEGIDSGTVAVELDAGALGRVLELPVSIADGRVGVTVAGRRVSAEPAVDAGALVLRVAGVRTLRVPIGRSGLVNCTATAAEVVASTIRLTCEIDEVPPALRR